MTIDSAPQIWDAALGMIREHVSTPIYQTWFRGIRPGALEPSGLILLVPSRFAKEWLEPRYLSLISQAVAIGCAGALIANALLWQQLWLLFVLAGLLAGAFGVQRPSVDALVPLFIPQPRAEGVTVAWAAKITPGAASRSRLSTVGSTSLTPCSQMPALRLPQASPRQLPLVPRTSR